MNLLYYLDLKECWSFLIGWKSFSEKRCTAVEPPAETPVPKERWSFCLSLTYAIQPTQTIIHSFCFPIRRMLWCRWCWVLWCGLILLFNETMKTQEISMIVQFKGSYWIVVPRVKDVLTPSFHGNANIFIAAAFDKKVQQQRERNSRLYLVWNGQSWKIAKKYTGYMIIDVYVIREQEDTVNDCKSSCYFLYW